MKYAAIVLFVVIPSASAQIVKDVPPPPPNAAYSYDCSKLPSPSEGCKSFNEMIENDDQDVTSALKTPGGVAYACFLPGEDEFLIVSFGTPQESLYAPATTPGASKNILKTLDSFVYLRFTKGVQNTSNVIFGNWIKYKSLPDLKPSFSGKADESKSRADVNDSEVEYSYTFDNLRGTKTTYSLQIRRSTLRFNETFDVPEISQAKNANTIQNKSVNRYTNSGYCSMFQSPSL
jgi:hypothetical protein